MNRWINILLLCLSLSASGQGFWEDSDTLNHKRLWGGLGTSAGVWGGSLGGLSVLWYDKQSQGKFHFFNDGDEWGQMDKVGHGMTAWMLSEFHGSMLRWSGVDEKKSAIYGGLIGFGYMSMIEFLDARSLKWGFSGWDMVANFMGSLMYTTQQLIWNEQRFQFSFSFWPSGYAELRPSALGDNLMSQSLKDYNGQTYWLDVFPGKFMQPSSRFPRWLGFSLGYSIDAWLVGDEDHANLAEVNGDPVEFDRVRQFYFSLEFDLTQVKTRSAFLRRLLTMVNKVKIPLPALSMDTTGRFRLYGIYF